MIFLVTGTGRSGTSYVARLMHERVGVCMGYEFIPANQRNPYGYYEDKEVVQFNKNWYENPLYEWSKIRAFRNSTFGIKDPRIADHLGFYQGLPERKKFIWCIRDEENTLHSLRKTYSREKAKEIYLSRTANMRLMDESSEEEVVKIFIGKESEEEILNKLYDCSDIT